MGTPRKVKKLEAKHGNLDEVIPALVNDLGQKEAGERLGVSESTINTWLKKNGYKRVTQYIKLDVAS